MGCLAQSQRTSYVSKDRFSVQRAEFPLRRRNIKLRQNALKWITLTRRMILNAPIDSGSREESNNRRRRKRPRNETLKTRFSCTNALIVPLTVAGIVALCSLNVADDYHHPSFAFAFHHPGTFSTIQRRVQYSIANKNDSHDRSSRPRWILEDSYSNGNQDVSEDAEKRQNSNSSIRSSGNRNPNDFSLVVASLPSLRSNSNAAFSDSKLPPWLAWAEEELVGVSSSRMEASKRVRREIEFLEGSLMSFRGGDFFSKDDVRDVIRAIYWCASSGSEDRSMNQRVSKIVGSVSFCRLLLQLEDDTFDGKKLHQHDSNKDDNKTTNKDGYLITKDVLLASILHYSECVDLRYDGVYEKVRNHSGGGAARSPKSQNLSMLSSKIADNKKNERSKVDKTIVLSRDENHYKLDQGSSISMRREPIGKKNDDAFENIFSPESLELATAATRLKRVEILTSVTLTSTEDNGKRRRPLSSSEYAAARNLMVSLTDDWRALAIRCAASLFRLEGIIKNSKINAGTGDFSRRHIRRGAETTLAAKDSLRMYANLSQQMGLHRLHSQLEARAFRILYPRQYSASSALFQEHGTAMNAISGFLSNQLKQLLYEDLSLMHELENLEVVSRVKEPYSFWKKLLKKRINSIAMPANDYDERDRDDDKISDVGKSEQYGPQSAIIRSPPDLSILEVNDGVALRVILKARKLHVDETAETTRARERMLCYYIHHMVRAKWPETDLSRVKDYIRYPKANGYQSLHHTSKITRNEKEFHFEVQIRSEEMHRLAEFGVAAHSAYKLGGDIRSPTSYPSLKASGSSSTTVSSTVAQTVDSSIQSPALTLLSNEESRAPAGRELQIVGVSDSGNSGPYINALQNARQTLMQSHVYVFLTGCSSSTLESGQLLALSAGSLIIDVLETLREVNEEFSFKDHEVQVWCNGNLALLEQHIKNGDMILIQPIQPSLPPITEILVNKTSSSNSILVS